MSSNLTKLDIAELARLLVAGQYAKLDQREQLCQDINVDANRVDFFNNRNNDTFAKSLLDYLYELYELGDTTSIILLCEKLQKIRICTTGDNGEILSDIRSRLPPSTPPNEVKKKALKILVEVLKRNLDNDNKIDENKPKPIPLILLGDNKKEPVNLDNIFEKINDVIESNIHRYIIIWGESGLGKTTILKQANYELIKLITGNQINTTSFLIPIYLQLSTWTKEKLFRLWIKQQLSDSSLYNIREKYHDALLDDRKTILLLDGFDEIDGFEEEATQKYFCNTLKIFLEKYSNLTIILTSKKVKFPLISELEKVQSDRKYTIELTLQHLNKKQKDDYIIQELKLKNFKLDIKEIRQSTWDFLTAKNSAILALIEKPLFLTIAIDNFKAIPEHQKIIKQLISANNEKEYAEIAQINIPTFHGELLKVYCDRKLEKLKKYTEYRENISWLAQFPRGSNFSA